MARISSIHFDKREHLKRATIITKLGTIKVEWRDVCGDLCWFTTGNLEARKLAVTAIERIEHMVVKTRRSQPQERKTHDQQP